MKKPGLKCFFALACLLSLTARPLSALSTAIGPLGLGASALGSAGTGVATASATEALFWNPAGLPQAGGWDLAWDAGSGGPTNSFHQALVLAGELADAANQDAVGKPLSSTHVGLLVQDQRYGQAGGFSESDLGLAASVGAGRWISLGTVQHLRQAEPGGLRGWSMDLGALASAPLGGGWRLRLGASASDLLSSLAWANGLEEAQPSVMRLGAAVEPQPGWWLALQNDHLDRQGSGGADQWRVGVQAAFLDQRLFARAGATQATGGDLYATAGTGGTLVLAGQRLDLDYALLMPTSASDTAALRHVLDLHWRYGWHDNQPKAGLARLLKDPRTGKVANAKIALAQAPKDTEDWQLDLKDDRGKVVRSYKGKGLLPSSVNWDGKDDLGQPVATEGLQYDLRTTSTSGQVVQRRALLGPSAGVDGTVDQELAQVEGASYGLRSAAAPAMAARPKLRLKGTDSYAVSAADIDLSGVAEGGEAQRWEVRIVDAGGQTVKKISGTGRPPKTVRWEGTNDLGQPTEVDLGASYQLRVVDDQGQESVRSKELVSDATFVTAVQAALQGTSQPKTICERDPATGEMLCTVRFDLGASQLDRNGEKALAQLIATASAMQFTRARIEGHADSEGSRDLNFQLSQARADLLMKVLLEKADLKLQDAVVAGLADTKPVADNTTDEGRAQNRRVEVRFR